MVNESDLIKEKYAAFVDAWKNNRLDAIDDVVTEAPDVRMSIIEPVYGREILKKRLAASMGDTYFSSLEIFNQICRVSGSEAQHSAALRGEVLDGKRKPYRFCAMSVSHFVKRSDGWRMDALSLDVKDDNLSECGYDEGKRYYFHPKKTSEYAFPAWKEIWNDIAVFDGCALPCVCAELQAPWVVIPNDESEKDEYEKLKEFVYAYLFAADYRMTGDFSRMFLPDAVFNVNLLGEYTLKGGVSAVKAVLQTSLQRGLHVVTDEKIELDSRGGFADVFLSCSSPALYNEEIKMTLRKSNDVWKILSVKTIAM